MSAERMFPPEHKDFLHSAERRRLLDAEGIVAALPLAPGQTVADVGCGTGFFTEPLARALPAGKVLACDMQPEMCSATRQRMLEHGLANVEVFASTGLQLPVPDRSLDGIFAAFVLHETEHLDAFLAELRRVAKPGAWLAVLEFHRRPGGHGPPLHLRLAPDEVRAALFKSGFTPAEAAADLSEQHYLLLAKG